MVTAGWLLRLAGAALGAPAPAEAFRDYLAAGAWLWFPLWGAALGAAFAGLLAGGATRLFRFALALGLALAPLVLRPAIERAAEEQPRSPRAKARAILRWSYRSPEHVRRIVGLSHDPDPHVREQAVLALGVNLVVTDIEHATGGRPARYLDSPVRGELLARLHECLLDSVEAIRAEAARALWKAPVAFGPQPAAAETLAAILDRAAAPEAVERLAWLALDAAAGTPDSALKAAAGRFAATTADSELSVVAGRAARWPAAAGSGMNPLP
jgi:hypothetical protein